MKTKDGYIEAGVKVGSKVKLVPTSFSKEIQFEIPGTGTYSLYDKTKCTFLGVDENGRIKIRYKNYECFVSFAWLSLEEERPQGTKLMRAPDVLKFAPTHPKRLNFENLFETKASLDYKPGKLYRFHFYPEFKRLAGPLQGTTVLFVELVIKQNVLKCRVIHGEQLCEVALMSIERGGPIFHLVEVEENE